MKRELGTIASIVILILILAAKTGFLHDVIGPGPAKSIQYYCELEMQFKGENCQDIGYKASSGDDSYRQIKNVLTKVYGSLFDKNLQGIHLSSDQVNQIVEARMKAQEKVSIRTEEVFKDGSNAKVKVTVGYIPNVQILTETDVVVNEAVKGPCASMNSQEADRYLADLLTRTLVEKYKNFAPGDTKSVVVDCIKDTKYHCWKPVNETATDKILDNIVVGNKVETSSGNS